MDSLLVNNNLSLGMVGHPLLQKARMIIMGVGQEDIVDVFQPDQQLPELLQRGCTSVLVPGSIITQPFSMGFTQVFIIRLPTL